MALNLALEVKQIHGSLGTYTAHRDLKPHNVMLDAAGQMYIIDAGVGKTHGEYLDNQYWGSCGTVAFVAPEQIIIRLLQTNSFCGYLGAGKIHRTYNL